MGERCVRIAEVGGSNPPISTKSFNIQLHHDNAFCIGVGEMSILLYWKGDNYIADMATGKAYHLNQSNELVINLKAGEHVWAFTRIEGIYVLAADLIVINTKHNSPGYKYGSYRAIGDRQKSRYFNVNAFIDVEPEIRNIFPQAPTHTKTGRRFSLGSFFEGINGVRPLNSSDEKRLIAFSAPLPII